jgi:hypothetical protein
VEIAAGVVGQVGLACSPVSVIGTGSGASCNQQPMCCSNNKMVSCKRCSLPPVFDRNFRTALLTLGALPLTSSFEFYWTLDLTRVITWYIVFLISFIASNTRAVWFASNLIGLAVKPDSRPCDCCLSTSGVLRTKIECSGLICHSSRLSTRRLTFVVKLTALMAACCKKSIWRAATTYVHDGVYALNN